MVAAYTHEKKHHYRGSLMHHKNIKAIINKQLKKRHPNFF